MGCTIKSIMLMFYVCLVTLITTAKTAEKCEMINSCSCENSMGVIDLSPLSGSGGEPAFKDYEDKLKSYYYSWNPCNPFTQDPAKCANVAACRTNMNEYYSLGTPDSARFEMDDTKGLILRYSSAGLIKRSLDVILVCDESINANLSVNGETKLLQYEMTLRSKYCCFQSNNASTTDSSTPFTDSTPSGDTSSSSELPSGSTQPSSESTMPISGSTNPNTGSTNPNTGSTNPDTGSTNPNTGSTNPNTGSTNPNTGSTNPLTGSNIPMTTPMSAASSLQFRKFFALVIVMLLKFAI